jgi:hypothetical protein
VNGPLLLFDGEDPLGVVEVCNGDTLLKQWMIEDASPGDSSVI